MDTGITLHAGSLIPDDPVILSQGQRPGRALSHTDSAVYTEPSCFGIMTIFAVNVADLEENGSSVSRTVYTAERNDSIYNGFHQRTFLSRI